MDKSSKVRRYDTELDLPSTKQVPKRTSRCSTSEKLLLFLIATSALIMCIGLLTGLGIMASHHLGCRQNSSKPPLQKREIDDRSVVAAATAVEELSTKEQCKEFCTSATCQDEAKFVLQNLDDSVDPCDDFYRFSCGGFLRNAEIPNDTDHFGMLNMLQRRITGKMMRELSEPVRGDELAAIRKIKTIYHNCMNSTRIEQDAVKTLLQILDSFGGWPVLRGDDWRGDDYSWPETVKNMVDYNFPLTFPFYFYISSNPNDTSRRVIKIEAAYTQITKTYLLDGPEGKLMRAYYDYLVNLAVLLGADKERAGRDARECIEFETALYSIQLAPDQAYNETIANIAATVGGLSEKYPSVPWLKLINQQLSFSNESIDESEVVVVHDPNFIAELVKLLERTDRRVLANYLIWQLVVMSDDYMPERFLDSKLQFKKVATGVKERKNRAKECILDYMTTFSVGLGSLYARKHFNPRIRETATELVTNVKNEFRKMLEEVDWMDEETRRTALDKMDELVLEVGYADELLDDAKIEEYYDGLVIEEGNFLRSELNVSRFFNAKRNKDFRKPSDKNDWSMRSVLTVNAFNVMLQNYVEIPAGILGGSFYNMDRPNYLNYGAIGSIVGHEITHGFDNEGRKYDKRGNRVDWWRNGTKQTFLEKAKCIVEQYGNYTVEEIGMKINGKLTQGENIADNGGYKVAYRAYSQWLKGSSTEPCLPGLSYTPRQLFWVSAASSWCSKEHPEYARNKIAVNPHSANVARVNIPLSNVGEFARDFGCKRGSRMVAEKKCVVW